MFMIQRSHDCEMECKEDFILSSSQENNKYNSNVYGTKQRS